MVLRGVLRYDGYKFYMEYDPDLHYPDSVMKFDAEILKSKNYYLAEQRRIREERLWHGNFARRLQSIEQDLNLVVQQELERESERADRSRKLEAKWKAKEESFFLTHGLTYDDVINGKPPKFSPLACVVPNPPMDAVHEEVDIHILDTDTTESVEVPSPYHADATIDVVHAVPIDHSLQVPTPSVEIDEVTVDLYVDPIPQPVDLIEESIMATPSMVDVGIGPVQSEGSTVHSAVLVATLKDLQATHVYFDPYLRHCCPLDFVIADFYILEVTFSCDVMVLSFSVVEWMRGIKIFVFDPGGFEDESF